MAITTENGTIPERLDWSYDNRDAGETWLQLEGTGDYISVPPIEMMSNMIENCYNEDVTFLFWTFCDYLTYINNEDIKEQNDIDHIIGFRDYLTNMIEANQG